MLAGIDDIDWAAMNHAYGPAGEVPDLLRGLVSDDPAVRERALDAMYGAVHHQGDVYECTLAVVPFLLEAAANPALPGRAAIVSLLASIGGEYEHDAFDDEEELDEFSKALMDRCETPGATLFRNEARLAVAAAVPELMELLADAAAEVRTAVPRALLTCQDGAGPVVATLQRRLPAESDTTAKATIVDVVGSFGKRAAVGRAAGVDPDAVESWLAEVASGSQQSPHVRLAAVGKLAGWAPTRLPLDIPSIGELLRAGYAAGTPPVQPAGFTTDTLVGAIRTMWEQQATGRRAPDAAAVVRELSTSLGERVDDRVELLATLLRAPEWEARHDAVYPARTLIQDWRGDFEELVFLLGEQLADAEPRLVEAAVDTLFELDELAAPAADALARSVAAAPREASPRGWITPQLGGLPTLGRAVTTLAGLRDARAMPALRWALARPEMPQDVGWAVGSFGPAAADLVPMIRQRLRDLPSEEHDPSRYGLAHALGKIGQAAAAAVPELLALAAARYGLEALARIGPPAADAVPTIQRLLDHGDPGTEITAAAALWHITADPGPVLPVLTRYLNDDRYRLDALATVRDLGPIAAPVMPKLRRIFHSDDSYLGHQLYAAQALWRITGDATGLLPTLTAAWSASHLQVEIAQCFTEMGSAAAATAPLLREELDRRQRSYRSGGGSGNIWGLGNIASDLKLVRTYRAALAAVGR